MSKGKRGKKGKAETGGKKIQIPFRFLDLPTDLIEEVAKFIKQAKQLRTLANLTQGNRFLHEAIRPFLWETVTWTIKSWKAAIDSFKTRETDPKLFDHIKYMYILDTNGELGPNDTPFWAPLFLLPSFNRLTFGQMAHSVFPNLKYAICFTPRCSKRDRILRHSPSVYISDQNLIEAQDTAALRKLVFEILHEYDYAKKHTSAEGCIDMGKNLQFYLDCTNQPEFAAVYDMVQNMYTESEIAPGRTHATGRMERNDLTEKSRIFFEFHPFRSIAILAFDLPLLIRFHLLTNTPPEDAKHGIRKKILDIFCLVRRALKEDMGENWTLLLGLDLVSAGRAAVSSVLERTVSWFNELASYTPPTSAVDDPDFARDPPFNFFIRMRETMNLEQFQTYMLKLFAALRSIYANPAVSPNARSRLPVCVEVQKLPMVIPHVQELFVRANFTDLESTRSICIGTHDHVSRMYTVRRFLQAGDGTEIPQGQHSKLRKAFLDDWPGASVFPFLVT